MNTKSELIRVKTALERFDISRSGFYRAAREGHLTLHKASGMTYVDAAEIERWIRGETAAA